MEAKQLRFFNPDNPPQAWSKEEGNAKLEEIKSYMRQSQMDRVIRHNNLKRQRTSDQP